MLARLLTYLARLMARSTKGVASNASAGGGFCPLVRATRGLHGMQRRTHLGLRCVMCGGGVITMHACMPVPAPAAAPL